MNSPRLILFAVVCSALVSQAGSVRTRDGRVIEGQIALGVESIRIVTPQGKTETLPLSQLKQALFDSPAAVVPVKPATNPPAGLALRKIFPHGTVPMGILTWSGAFLARSVSTVDDSAVHLADPLAGFTLTTANTSAIFFQPLTPYRASALRASRPGVLLVSGDFVEGEIKSIQNSQIKLGSVLFGERSFEVGREAAAVMLRKFALPAEQFEIRLRDGSVLFARALRAEVDMLVLDDPFLRGLCFPAAQLEEIAFGKGTNRLAFAWSEWEMLAETDRQRAEQQEKLIVKIALEQGLRWRTHADILVRARVAAEKTAEKILVLANAERDLVIAGELTFQAAALHTQATTNFPAKDKIYAELRRKADLLGADAKSKSGALGGTKTEFERVASKMKLDRTVAETSLASLRRGADFAVKVSESRLKGARDLKESAAKSLVSSKSVVAMYTESLEKARKQLVEADQDVAVRKNRLASAKEAEQKAAAPSKKKEAEAVAAGVKSLASMQKLRTLVDTSVKKSTVILMRSKIEEDVRAKTLVERNTNLEKVVAEITAAEKKAKDDVTAAEMKLAKVITDAEKLLTEMQTKLKQADTDKAVAEKAAIEAVLIAEKSLAEKNNAYNAILVTRATLTKAEAESIRKRALFNEAKDLANRAQAEKVAVEQLLVQQAAGTLPK